MCEIVNSVRLSWQLVSQFVSWDFCRYMSEQGENSALEPDVLTFLRNMIVERTEKAACHISKHEIVAKFIMEARCLRTMSRMPCITELAESVKKICPELEAAVNKLLHHLKSLLSALDWNVDKQNEELVELVQCRLSHAVNDFNLEAYKLLPMPELLQVIQCWLQPTLQSKLQRRRGVENLELYQKVISCLQKEIITPTEAKIIAKALYEDKNLEKVFLNFSDLETEDESPLFNQPLESSEMPIVNSRESIQLSSYYNLIDCMQKTITDLQKPTDSENSFSLESSLHKITSKQGSRQNTKNSRSVVSQPSDSENSSSLDLQHREVVASGKQISKSMHIHNDSDDSLSLESLTHEDHFEQTKKTSSAKNHKKQDSQDTVTSRHLAEQIQEMEPLNPVESFLFEPFYSKPFSGTQPRRMEAISPTPTYSPPDSPLFNSFPPARKTVRRKSRVYVESEEELSDQEDVQKVAAKKTNNDVLCTDPLDWIIRRDPPEENSDCSDVDQNPMFRILTPTIYKQDYQADFAQPANRPSHLTDDNSNNSPAVNNIDSQQNDPNWPSALPSTATKSQKSKSSQAKKNNKPPARKRKKTADLIQQGKSPGAKRQTTLRDFLPPDTSCKISNEKKKTTKRKVFKLFDNDLMPSLNETALFQEPRPQPKQAKITLTERLDRVGNKRKCTECGKTFRTTSDLKKHIFIEHIPDDIHTPSESFTT